jgi:hypothetical protein
VVAGNGEFKPPKGTMPVDHVVVDVGVGGGGRADNAEDGQRGRGRQGAGEPGHGASNRSTDAVGSGRRLDRSGSAQRIELPRLDRAQTVAQLVGILEAAPPVDLVDAVFGRSEGNPFFTEELLAAVRAGSGELPATVRDLLRGVQVLPARAHHVLAVAAVAGQRVPHRLLASVAGLDDQNLLEALRVVVAHQLLVTRPEEDGYQFRHALLQEVVNADLLPGERAQLHAAYAHALTQRPELAGESPAVRAAELAIHWEAAGEATQALPARVQAGLVAERAAMLLCLLGGLRHEALHHGAPLAAYAQAEQLLAAEAPPAERARVLANHAHGLLESRRPQEAIPRCEDATAVARLVGLKWRRHGRLPSWRPVWRSG